jgi:hypothetical protein
MVYWRDPVSCDPGGSPGSSPPLRKIWRQHSLPGVGGSREPPPGGARFAPPPPPIFFSLGFASVPAGAGDGEARLHGLRFEPSRPGGEDGRSERPPAVSVNVRGTRLQGGFNTSSTRSGGGGNQEVT